MNTSIVHENTSLHWSVFVYSISPLGTGRVKGKEGPSTLGRYAPHKETLLELIHLRGLRLK